MLVSEQGDQLPIATITAADSAIQRIEEKLPQARSVADANSLAASAEVLRNIIKRANLGFTSQNHAAAVAIKARRAAGEMVMLLERKHNIDGGDMSPLQRAALDAGVSKATLMRWQKMAKDLTDELIDEAEAQANRENREMTTRDVWARARVYNPGAFPEPEKSETLKRLEGVWQSIWKLPDPRDAAAELKDLENTAQWQDAIQAYHWCRSFLAEFKPDESEEMASSDRV